MPAYKPTVAALEAEVAELHFELSEKQGSFTEDLAFVSRNLESTDRYVVELEREIDDITVTNTALVEELSTLAADNGVLLTTAEEVRAKYEFLRSDYDVLVTEYNARVNEVRACREVIAEFQRRGEELIAKSLKVANHVAAFTSAADYRFIGSGMVIKAPVEQIEKATEDMKALVSMVMDTEAYVVAL